MRQLKTAIEIRYYLAQDRSAPFIKWLEGLNDRVVRARIKVRIDRLERGLFGDTRALGGGIEELRIHAGPGYRIYYGRIERTVILLLSGGTKDRQQRDIERARQYWAAFLEASNGTDEEAEERGL